MGGWKYYNHAAIPTCAPHEVPDLAPVMDGIIWKDCDGKKHFLHCGQRILTVALKQIGGMSLKIRPLILWK